MAHYGAGAQRDEIACTSKWAGNRRLPIFPLTFRNLSFPGPAPTGFPKRHDSLLFTKSLSRTCVMSVTADESHFGRSLVEGGHIQEHGPHVGDD